MSSPTSGSVSVFLGAVIFAFVVVVGTTSVVRQRAKRGPDGNGTLTTVTSPETSEDDGQDGSDNTTSSSANTTQSSTETSPRQPVSIQPVSARATNTRPSVSRLRCGGSNSFEAPLLIDGDFNTGWGASSSDGTGQAVTVDFGRVYRLTEVGITPGYFRVAPRFSAGCENTNAYFYNRRILAVRYRFDDGSSVDQQLSDAAELQRIAVDVLTQSVTIEILGTERWGEDDDTIISEAAFAGTDP